MIACDVSPSKFVSLLHNKSKSEMKLLRFFNRRKISTSAIRRNSLSEQTEQLAKAETPIGSTMDASDVQHHSSLSNKWWDINGELKGLHAFNPLRVQLVRDGLANTGAIISSTCLPLQGIKIADVGCGGGILSEALARIGANVTGIDASEELTVIAADHAKLDPSLNGRLNYICTTIEKFVEQSQNAYDAIVASEVLEHVNDKELFLKCCVDVIKPGGSLFITTFNKTLLSWFGGIIAAERIFKFIPRGTHDWNKFISPTDTQRLLESCDCKIKLIHGTFYNPLTSEWSWASSTIAHYALHAVKRGKRQ